MPLTDVKIRSAKPSDRTLKLSDGEGLQLWISPAGARTWRLAYRSAGKQRAIGIGPYPAVSLSAARRARDAAKRLLATGNDPAAHGTVITVALDEARRIEAGASPREATAAAAEAAKQREAVLPGESFREVAKEWLAKTSMDGRAEVTVEKVSWLLGFALDELGEKSVRSISSREVLGILRKVEARGRIESANRLRSVIGRVFRYAIATDKAENDPTIALRGAIATPVVRHRPAIVEEKPFGALLRAVWGFEGLATIRYALKLMAYLAPRPGELRLAEWSEFDLDGAAWNIPAGRMKMRRPHRKPLPLQALALLRELHDITGEGRLVLPGQRVWTRPLSENTLNACLRRLGYSADEVTAHGFRASFSTIANQSGKWSADAIEKELGHLDEDEARRAYARGMFWTERIDMMQWWADRCDELRQGNATTSSAST
ncbi:tyrosine-type recombinase/integrase [Bosea sp. RCC_152_1]|uniref:tyrosine-type recombinase/integrase n=1 Tax=Bosea sp. RCC_152_1 TaxID=3239228 RepID=UPI003526B5BB